MKLSDMFSTIQSNLNELPLSRREALSRTGNFSVKALIASLPLALGATLFTKKAAAQSTATIIETLNFALTLEYLEAQFYVQGLGTGVIPTGDRAVFTQISKHESAHVIVLRQTIQSLGGTPVEQPVFDFTAGGLFPSVFTNYATFLTVSQAFEDTGVRAYKGQAGNLISSDAVLTAALQIHSVEARHASEVRRIRGQKGWIVNSESGGAPDAVYSGESNITQGGVNITAFVSMTAATESFDEPLTKQQVLDIVNPFIV